MRLIFFLLAFVSSTVYAKSKGFQIQTKEISVNGNLVPNLRTFTVNPNQKEIISTLTDENGTNTIIEMTAMDDSSGGIFLKFTVAEESNGNRKVIANPQIIAMAGEEATITESEEGQNKSIKIAIIANRIR